MEAISESELSGLVVIESNLQVQSAKPRGAVYIVSMVGISHDVHVMERSTSVATVHLVR